METNNVIFIGIFIPFSKAKVWARMIQGIIDLISDL